MRFSIIPLFLLFFTFSSLAAQSTQVPPSLELISEDDLKLGLYNSPMFQPIAKEASVREAEASAQDNKLLFVLGEAPFELKFYRVKPSLISIYLSGLRQGSSEDSLAVVYSLRSVPLTY